MPPLPLLGALIDTAGAALGAIRGAGSSAGSDAATAPAAAPFAQTLKHSVAARHDTANGSQPDTATKHVSSKPAGGAMPAGDHDDKSAEDTNTATQGDAAALAAAAAVQAQLQVRTNDGTPAGAGADAATAAAASARPDATGHASHDATAVSPSGRDALQAALAKLTGGAGAIGAGTASATSGSTAAAPPASKAAAFDRTLADAKGAFAAPQTPTPANTQALQAAMTAEPAAQPALAQAGDTASPSADAMAAAAATAAAAAQSNVPAAPAAGAIAAANTHVLTPQVGTADWTDALSQKVVFLSNAHQQSAELTLNPPDLGPLQVVLRVADNHAHALFVSQHAQVREAVEAALPKLREAMEAGGLGLGSASVSDGGFASQQQNAQQSFAGGQSSQRARAGSPAPEAPVAAVQSAAAVATVGRVGLVDTFA
ncbi:flagellar hook-length control protein FliK [Burkholderia sp. IMCC1007]|uniref:flagellar hook-length control protein FliK n=1 Tax=Burkholderia sp. IMCC1007 TaxID=3004104 RepID=UPI0022B3256D|nr:flagellar hook-length control protein FliK [Burkholderia sp. IMCC1007]